jgi:hypothetical protein
VGAEVAPFIANILLCADREEVITGRRIEDVALKAMFKMLM